MARKRTRPQQPEANTPDALRAPWRNRIVGYGQVAAATLLANPKNYRIHPERQIAALEGSLDTLGWIQNVLVNRLTGFVLDGHARAAQAVKRGEQVPVAYVELDPDEEALAITILDAITEMAETDRSKLDALIGGIRLGDMHVGPGLDGLLQSMCPPPPAPAEDDVPELPAVAITRRGYMWLLGPHRLFCGDSTSQSDVNLLLAGMDPKPFLMVTDEPYGVSLDPSWRQAAGLQNNTRQSGLVQNDDRCDWSAAYALFPGDVAYLWHAGVHAAEVAEGLRKVDFEIRAQIIWKKQRFVISRGAYHWGHEPCWYAVRGGRQAHWRGDRKQSTVWEVDNLVATNRADDSADPENAITGHGTQKPVELFRRPILNHTAPAEAIYDPFTGSGTSLIAAELTGRTYCGLELDPRYADVIVQRWQNMTKRQATLAATGETFEQARASRAMQQAAQTQETAAELVGAGGGQEGVAL